MSENTHKNVVVATDFSVESDEALRRGIEIARGRGGTVRLVHVEDHRPPVCVGDWCLGEADILRVENDTRERLSDELHKQVNRVAAGTDARVEVDLRWGDPAEQLAKAESESGSDIMLLPAHTRGSRHGRLLSSQAGRIVRRARGAVLLVHC